MEKVLTTGVQLNEEWVVHKKLCLASCWRLLVCETPKKPCLPSLSPPVSSSVSQKMLTHLSLSEAPFFLLGLGEQVTE